MSNDRFEFFLLYYPFVTLKYQEYFYSFSVGRVFGVQLVGNLDGAFLVLGTKVKTPTGIFGCTPNEIKWDCIDI